MKMRPIGFSLRISPGFREVPRPGNRLAPANWVARRRLDDALVEIFNRACAGNNLDAAADLLALLEKWHERRKSKYRGERRISDESLIARRAELERLTALRMS
jgi:hypothetical protein